MLSDRELMEEAQKSLKNSYSPYSHFKVAAALMTKEGKIYTGCNIENASYGATVCAERVAFFKAISAGEKEFESIAIVSESDSPCPPCGICRQVMSEFCDGEFRILLSKNNEIKIYTLQALLPLGFSLDKE